MLFIHKRPQKLIHRLITIASAMVIAMIAACSDNNDAVSNNVVSANTPNPTDINTTVNVDTETKDTPTISSNKIKESLKDYTPGPKTELEKVEQHVKELQTTLDEDNQDNAALRQKINALKEKIEENQRIINQQEQQTSSQ